MKNWMLWLALGGAVYVLYKHISKPPQVKHPTIDEVIGPQPSVPQAVDPENPPQDGWGYWPPRGRYT